MSESEFMLIDGNYSHQRSRFVLKVLVIGFALIVTFVTITLIISSNSPTTTRPKFVSNCSVSYSYDYNLLSLRWPTTFCTTHKCVKHDNKWVIHGLWPTYDNQSWPQFCCFDRIFNVTNLNPIVSELKSIWPNLEPDASYDSLWRHEWQKHGTCTKTKQIDYFNTTLLLYKKYPIFEWLQDSKIVPSTEVTYYKKALTDALRAKLGHTVGLECLASKGKVMLDQIYICLNHSSKAELIDCLEESNCKESFYYLK